MALVTTTEMFKKAYAGKYAVGAFNINNMEIIQAIAEAAAVTNDGKITMSDVMKVANSLFN